MGFETKVLDIVAEVLENDHSANFFYGTLCVDCTPSQLTLVKTALRDNMICNIQISRTSTEYLIDFV